MALNKLTLNLYKTNCVMFGSHHTLSIVNNNPPKVTYSNMEVKIVSEVKYLGIMLDPKLSFNIHAEYIRKKCVGRLKMLGRTRGFVDQETSLQLYKSLIVT